MIYSYPASIRVRKFVILGSSSRIQCYYVEKCVSWNPEVWVILEGSDYLHRAITLAKSLAWVFCHSIEDQKKILEKK